ncbi:AMP-binding protein [Actinomadura oligospora]|uniref:AMP-binding protein n=1 Tax=Actinomadura oligospora TaxID=111804 RepID=UPI0004AFEA56|nr:AMP-binding protein [Actinomadura oligospora]
MTLIRRLLDQAARTPSAVALVAGDGTELTYGELRRRVLAVRNGLRANGMRAGDGVLFSVRPSPDSLVLALGVVAAGGVVIFADPGAGPEMFAARLRLASPRWSAAESVLYAASRLRPVRALARRRGLLLPHLADLPLRHIHTGPHVPGVPPNSLSLKTLLTTPTPHTTRAPNTPDAPDPTTAPESSTAPGSSAARQTREASDTSPASDTRDAPGTSAAHAPGTSAASNTSEVPGTSAVLAPSSGVAPRTCDAPGTSAARHTRDAPGITPASDTRDAPGTNAAHAPSGSAAPGGSASRHTREASDTSPASDTCEAPGNNAIPHACDVLVAGRGMPPSPPDVHPGRTPTPPSPGHDRTSATPNIDPGKVSAATGRGQGPVSGTAGEGRGPVSDSAGAGRGPASDAASEERGLVTDAADEGRGLVMDALDDDFDLDPDAPAAVIFTSGTTEKPRAVVHTQASLVAALDLFRERLPLGPGDVVHTDQLMLGLPTLVSGARWSMPPLFASPRRFALQLRERGATHTFCVPVHLAEILDVEPSLPKSLRYVLLGAAPAPAGVLRRAIEAAPHAEVLSVYAMTEILPVAIASAKEKLAHTSGGDLLGTPLVRTRVAPDGELWLTGPNLCRSYLGEAPITELPTGDLVRMESDRLVLIGRKKDMLIRGKFNLYPGLYEPAITTLDGVDEAAIVGVPDPETGDEQVVLAVTGSASPDSLRRRLPQLIDHDALPDRIVVLPSLPRSGRTRKLDRDLLREAVR